MACIRHRTPDSMAHMQWKRGRIVGCKGSKSNCAWPFWSDGHNQLEANRTAHTIVWHSARGYKSRLHGLTDHASPLLSSQTPLRYCFTLSQSPLPQLRRWPWRHRRATTRSPRTATTPSSTSCMLRGTTSGCSGTCGGRRTRWRRQAGRPGPRFSGGWWRRWGGGGGARIRSYISGGPVCFSAGGGRAPPPRAASRGGGGRAASRRWCSCSLQRWWRRVHPQVVLRGLTALGVATMVLTFLILKDIEGYFDFLSIRYPFGKSMASSVQLGRS